MTSKLYMSVVETPHPQASIIKPDEGVLPVLKGDADINLACGSCKVVLAQGVTVEGLAEKFAAPHQLLVQCPKCDAYNRLPATLGN